jgi:hypothetical protein
MVMNPAIILIPPDAPSGSKVILQLRNGQKTYILCVDKAEFKRRMELSIESAVLLNIDFVRDNEKMMDEAASMLLYAYSQLKDS